MTNTAAHWLSGTPMDPTAAVLEPLPSIPGFPILHIGSCGVIVGPTGRGRSSFVQAMLYDAGLAGQRCAYLGSEVTSGEFNARAAALVKLRGDQVDDDMRERLAAIRYLDLASTIAHAWVHPKEWVETVVDSYALIAIDPLSAAAAALDLDFDKSNHDYIRFYDRLVQSLTGRGVAVVLVDNVGHAEEARARAKGASAKSDRADLTFTCSPSAAPAGLAVKAGKVRSVRAGHQRGDEWLFLKDTQRVIARERNSTPDTTSTFRPTTIMQRVSEAVERDPGLSKRALRTAVGGKAATVDLALELLLSEGHIAAEEDGQTLHHRSLKPYRGDTVSTVSAPCPDRVPDTLPATVSDRVPPPVGGGPDGDTVSAPHNNNSPTVSHSHNGNGHDPDAELTRIGDKFQEAS